MYQYDPFRGLPLLKKEQFCSAQETPQPVAISQAQTGEPAEETVHTACRQMPPHCAVNCELDHSFTVGCTGPVLLSDSVLHEKLEIFAHKPQRPRVVHTKGYGAKGYFQLYQCMKPYTKACFLQDPGAKIPVEARFSLAVSVPGTPDTSRNVRGFSVKFYTNEGNFDLLCNHIPVFLIRDAIKFPDAIAALSPSPKNNLADGEAFWKFVAENPESLHFVTWLYSDVGTVKSLRHIPGHSVNTFVWRNAEGVRRYVKYHWMPLAGEQYITREEAELLAAQPDIAGIDLYNSIACGKSAEYELCVQLMEPEEANRLPYDPLDGTKVWCEKQFPLMKVGKVTLNANPDNYRCEVEDLAFSPNNLLPGIEFSDDKLLAGRANLYWDAQRYRLGKNFRDIPVNRDKNFSFASTVDSGKGEMTEGRRVREEIPKAQDFAQAGERCRMLSPREREHLADNIASQLYAVCRETQGCVMGYFRLADADFARELQQRMQHYSGIQH